MQQIQNKPIKANSVEITKGNNHWRLSETQTRIATQNQEQLYNPAKRIHMKATHNPTRSDGTTKQNSMQKNTPTRLITQQTQRNTHNYKLTQQTQKEKETQQRNSVQTPEQTR